MKKIFCLLLLISCTHLCYTQITLPRLIRDSMILQRDQPLNLWGWAPAAEKIVVKFNGKSYKGKADQTGAWKIQLPPTPAGGPYVISINNITLSEVLFGDVWLCSGQSNMVHQLNIHDVTYAKDIATANYPDIRQFWVPTQTNLSGPQKNISIGNWKAAVGEDVRPFSAVAYFFAKQLHDRFKVPIGIINASVGGTPIEAWTSEEGLRKFPNWQALIQKNKDTAYINELIKKTPNPSSTKQPVDAGMSATQKWYDPLLPTNSWKSINLPGYWEDQGIKDLNGIVWYRREFDLPASIAQQAAKVFLGRIVDADELYINGKLVGTTGYQYPQRRYKIPAGLLKPGKNSFTIRVTNNSGKGGFVTDKPYCLIAGTDTFDLKGYWKYKVGLVYPPIKNNEIAPAFSAQNQPASLFNAMVAHAIPYNIKGVCWYQGESNASRPLEYASLLPALIRDWRNKWQNDSLPFLNVQLPGFMDYNYLPSESNWALLREAQLKAATLPHSALVVAIDLGEWNDIHPDNKKSVGERLALAARKIAYGEDLVYSGPTLASTKTEGNKIILSFRNTGTGLTSSDGEALQEFAIAGVDKKFIWANAKIEGNKIIVWNDDLPLPLYVRYAWSDNPVNPNLINKEGLPASPFRTDEQ